MLLVDPSDPDQLSRTPPAMRAFLTKQGQSLDEYHAFAPLLIRFGVLRLMDSSRAATDPDGQDSLRQEMRYLTRQPKYVDAIVSEAHSMFSESADEVRAAGNLGDKPLVVLSAGEMDQPPALPRGVTQKDIDDLHRAFVEDLHAQEAHLSTRGRQVIVPDSRHMIPLERPEAVVSAVRDVWTAAGAK
jgi:pimeloyl-ACP methyl ester carboxylesterase